MQLLNRAKAQAWVKAWRRLPIGFLTALLFSPKLCSTVMQLHHVEAYPDYKQLNPQAGMEDEEVAGEDYGRCFPAIQSNQSLLVPSGPWHSAFHL